MTVAAKLADNRARIARAAAANHCCNGFRKTRVQVVVNWFPAHGFKFTEHQFESRGSLPDRQAVESWAAPSLSLRSKNQISDIYRHKLRLLLRRSLSERHYQPGDEAPRNEALWPEMTRKINVPEIHVESLCESLEQLDTVVSINPKISEKRRPSLHSLEFATGELRNECSDVSLEVRVHLSVPLARGAVPQGNRILTRSLAKGQLPSRLQGLARLRTGRTGRTSLVDCLKWSSATRRLRLVCPGGPARSRCNWCSRNCGRRPDCRRPGST